MCCSEKPRLRSALHSSSLLFARDARCFLGWCTITWVFLIRASHGCKNVVEFPKLFLIVNFSLCFEFGQVGVNFWFNQPWTIYNATQNPNYTIVRFSRYILGPAHPSIPAYHRTTTSIKAPRHSEVGEHWLDTMTGRLWECRMQMWSRKLTSCWIGDMSEHKLVLRRKSDVLVRFSYLQL